jgi:tetratricopeptide (TPR) repeat protein
MKNNKKTKDEESEFSYARFLGMASNCTEQAIESYLNVLKLNPDRIDVYYNLGQVYLRHALRHFKKVTMFNPDDAEAHVYLGKIQADMGYYWQANENFQKAIALNPDYVDAYFGLSAGYSKEGKHDEAAEYLQKALEIKKRLGNCYRNLPQIIVCTGNNLPEKTVNDDLDKGIALQEQENHTQAIRYFQKMIEANPNDAEGYYYLGLSHDDRQNNTLSMLCFKRAIEINPNHQKAWLKLADKLQMNKDIYLQYLQKIVSIGVCDEAVDSMLAIYGEQKNDDKVIECYQKLVEWHPKDIQILDRLAREYRRQNNPDEVINCYRKILKLKPRFAKVYNKLGFIYQSQNKTEQAVECFRKAAKMGNRRAEEWLTEDNMTKGQRITFAGLVNKYSWEELEPVFVKKYPKWKKNTSAYKVIFTELQSLRPDNNADMTIHIDGDDNHVHAYNNNPQKEQYSCSIGVSPWEECLGMDIAGETIENYSDEEIIIHILWEITFYGYSQEGIRNVTENWGRIRNYELGIRN